MPRFKFLRQFPFIFVRKNGFTKNRKGLLCEIEICHDEKSSHHEIYLSVAAIAKNEGTYIKEWIDFHKNFGVEHFLIYDNDSTDNTRDILAPYIRSGLVTCIPWPWFLRTHNPQSLAYAHALAMLSGVSRWVAFVDLDEFLFSKQQPSLPQALAEFEDEPALGVYWALFGTSGFATRQPGPVTQTYTRRLAYPCDPEAPAPYPAALRRDPSASHFKSIVQPLRVRATINPHCFKTDRFPVLAVDENRRDLREGEPRHVSFEKFQINHYFSKSREEFEERLQRRNVFGKSVRDKRERTLDLVDRCSVRDDFLVDPACRKFGQSGR